MDCEIIFFTNASSRVIWTESMRNPRKVIICVGVRIDLVGCIVNPKFCSSSIVLSMLWKHASQVLPCRCESSPIATDTNPLLRKCEEGTLDTYVNMRMTGPSHACVWIYFS